MEKLLTKFRESTHCESCIHPFDPLEGCMFKCGHTYHTKCIESMEIKCCFKCNILYRPDDVYHVANKFTDKLLEVDDKPTRKKIIKKSLELLVEAALLNHNEALYIIGISIMKDGYFDKILTDDDCLFCLNKSAHNGHLKSIHSLMNKYKNTNIPANIPLYYKYCEMAANQNDASAQCIIALYYEKTNPSKCIQYMKKSAENNYTLADQYMYKYYKQGKIINKNLDLAHEYLIKVANTGNSDAEVFMGDYYYDKDNHLEAIKWYKLASDKGNHNAQIQLAHYYIHGEYVRINYSLAYKLLMKNQDNIYAMYLIGYYYEHCTQNYTECFHWYLKSAEKNLSEAQSKLSYLYEHGLGVKKDLNQSFDWLLKSADNQYLDSQIMVGQKYEIGFNYKGNFIQSDKKAKKYYQLASKHGDLFSIEALHFYEIFDKLK